jgi:benzoylformate decarboxylase
VNKSQHFRNAADAFVEQLALDGVDTIFGNPGTTEYAVLDAICRHSGIDFILTLHEGVAVSAAGAYARGSGKVGVVELHAGPGLGNGLGMIYNAWASNTPLLVYVGQADQATQYLEPTLGGDLVAMARPVTKWAYEIQTAEEVPAVVRRALKVARTPPFGPVVLAFPMDLSERPCAAAAAASPAARLAVEPDPEAIAEAAALLLDATAPLLVPGDGVSRAGALVELTELAALLGAPISGGTMYETAFDPDCPLAGDRLPQGGREARAFLEQHDVILAVGTKVFTQLFPEPGDPAPSSRVIHIGLDQWELGKSQPSTIVFADERAALRRLLDALERQAGAETLTLWRKRRHAVTQRLRTARDAARAADTDPPAGTGMTGVSAIRRIAEVLPAETVVIDEGHTNSAAIHRYLPARPARFYRGRGGGIGEALPMAVGLKLARQEDPVVAFVGDGSALYSLTAIWTAARYGLPVIWVVLDNGTYQVLRQNADRRRGGRNGDLPYLGTDLSPAVDFLSVARSFGAEAERVSVHEEIGPAFERSLARSGPTLIDLVVQ